MPDSPDHYPLPALHDRLRCGEPMAPDDLARLLLPLLGDDLARRFPHADEQLIHDSVIDALLEYFASPQRFDASRNVPLDRFLASAASRNLTNSLLAEQRRKRREKAVGSKKREADVALDPAARNIQREDLEHGRQQRCAILAALEDPLDKEVLALMLDGVRDTATFARILHLTDLPTREQREEVKRRKDRITRRLRRKGLLP